MFARLENFLHGGTDFCKISLDSSSDPVLDQALHLLYDKKRFEIAKDKLKLGAKIGDGAFGVVPKGELFMAKGDVQVAIKYPLTYSESEHYEALISELKIMANGELYVVMELCVCSLSEFMRLELTIPNVAYPPKLSLSLEIAIGIADGMSYLASKGIIHRDLAARNVLLDEEAIPKIADYGLVRVAVRGYYKVRKSKSIQLPIPWMAQELLDIHATKLVTAMARI